jgi:hypothetical protein
MPNFDELFGRIALVSPLARNVFANKEGGFETADATLSKYSLDFRQHKLIANDFV